MLILIYFLTILSGCIDNTIYSLIESYLYDHMSLNINEILLIGLWGIISLCILYIFRTFSYLIEQKLIQKSVISKKIQDLKIYLISNMKIPFYDRMMNEYDLYEKYYLNNIFIIMRSVLEFLIAFVILSKMNVILTIVTIFVSIIPIILKSLIKDIGNKQYEKLTIKRNNLIDLIKSCINGYDEIYIYSLEGKVKNKAKEKIEKLNREKVKYETFMGIIEILLDNLSRLSYVIVILISIWYVSKGLITYSAFILFSSMNESVSYPLINIIQSYFKLNTIKWQKLSYNEKKHKTIKDTYLPIIVNDVHVSYGNQCILQNVNIQINKNERILITGVNGSGKSTLCKIIGGKISNNHILYNGNTMDDLDVSQLYMKVKYISDREYIFHDTVKNNILLGKDYLDISQLPEDILIILDHNAEELSLGQKQMICLYRSLLVQPEIIILDEALSAVSKEMSEKILEYIFKTISTVIQVDHHITKYDRYTHQYIIMNKNIS